MKRTFLVFVFCICTFGCGTSKDDRNEAITHLSNSMELQNQATRLMNSFPYFSAIPQSDMEQVKLLWRKSLEEAKLINIEAINTHYPGFGNTIEAKLIGGLQLCLERDNSSLIQCQVLLDEFGEELNELKKRTRK